jgi:RNA polymerase sigma-70 factor (ECF subfamily)
MPELRPDGLIVRIKRGDREALDDFFAAHWMRVHDWLSLEFGVPAGRGADACDVVQDVCLEVFQQIGGFRGETEAEMLAWVRTVLRHRVLDLGRKRILRTFDPSGHS